MPILDYCPSCGQRFEECQCRFRAAKGGERPDGEKANEMYAILGPGYPELLAQRDALLAAAEDAIELASWHTDDDAEETDVSPEDMVAHVNGLIRQKLSAAVKEVEGGAPQAEQTPNTKGLNDGT